MKITVLTIFPELFTDFQSAPVVKRAVERELLQLDIVDIKKFAGGSFRHIDDSPYGGGPGMILRCKPVADALRSLGNIEKHTVLLSPKGKTFCQQTAHRYSEMEHIVLICGHYEGVDARIEEYADEQLSIGDYILTGGELAAQVVIDSVARLLKGALRDAATEEETYENGLLEYPQYTRPAEYEGKKVPEVLLSGNQRLIDDWRLTQSLLLTKKLRPDLLELRILSDHEKELLKKYEDKE